MESALTPREIQARIRSGESVDSVAQAAGVPVERIDVYAGPVLAEREHITTLARTSQVRKARESGAHRFLGDVVTEALEPGGITPDQIRWDSWRDENRRWTIAVSWPSADAEQHAEFDFDPRARYSTAKDAAAKELIGERPAPTRRPGIPNPDAEPTLDLHDELAIVRVVQENVVPPAVLPDVPAARIIRLPGHGQGSNGDDGPDDYSDAELEQVDGVYDIVPNPRSDMDVLYDMLSGFNEDSVRIYTGLTQPVSTPSDPEPVKEPEPRRRPSAKTVPSDPRSRRRARQQPAPAVAEPVNVAVADDQTADPQEAAAAVAQETAPAAEQESASSDSKTTTAEPVAASNSSKAAPRSSAPRPSTPRPSAPRSSVRTEATADTSDKTVQDALLTDPKSPAPAPKPRKRRKRAEVPTWDEIMFGAPPPSDPSNP